MPAPDPAVRPRRCVLVGDAMMDVTVLIDSPIAYGSDTPAHVSHQPGGAAANTAAWLAWHGHPATLVACVGDDAFGTALESELVALGVERRVARVGGVATGTCVVIVDATLERTMFPDPGANCCLDVAQVDGLLAPGDHLHLSGYTLLNPRSRAAGEAILEQAISLGVTTSLDPASAGPLRENLPVFDAALTRVDAVLANEAEAEVLTSETEPDRVLDALAQRVPTAVVKRGPLGAMAVRRATGERVALPAPVAPAVDSTGAGDAFAAGFLPVWAGGGTLADAVAAGQAVAGEAISRVGASPLVRARRG